MLVKALGVEEVHGESVLRARVFPTARGTRSSFELEYAFRGMSLSRLSPTGDVFVPALLLPAMALGEDLEIEAPLSPQLLRGAAAAMDIYRAWGHGLERVRVLGGGDVRPPSGEGVALYFTAGVDSFYSLLKSERSDDGPTAGISHLLCVHGFDIDLDDTARWRSATASIEDVARASGKQALFARSNLRRFTDGLVPWPLYHGAALASVGLALEGLFERFVIASSWADGYLRPWGSHPLLDPLWSTEGGEFIHDGCEARRAEKVHDAIRRSPLALANLRVCWEHLTAAENCGRCEKCITTMAMLRAAGVLDASTTFPHPLELAAIRALRFDNDGTSTTLHGLLEVMRRDGMDDDLADAIRHAFRRRRLRRLLRRLQDRCRRQLRRAPGAGDLPSSAGGKRPGPAPPHDSADALLD